jgi:cytochrome bd ubiquinol oxidase subunit I
VAAFQAVGFAAAGIHAYKLLKDRDNDFHRKAYAIALAVGAAAAVLQPLSGDYLAKRLAVTQPLKLAAAEGQWETQRRAPLRIGGWPDEKTETTPYALEIPGGLSASSPAATPTPKCWVSNPRRRRAARRWPSSIFPSSSWWRPGS